VRFGMFDSTRSQLCRYRYSLITPQSPKLDFRLTDHSSSISLNLSGRCGPWDTSGLLLSNGSALSLDGGRQPRSSGFLCRLCLAGQSVLMVKYGIGVATKDDTRTHHPVRWRDDATD
jgi:hypothetical protein